MELNLLKLQSLWLHRSIRKKNLRINAILHSQLHLLTVLTELCMLIKDTDPFSLERMESILQQLKNGQNPWPAVKTIKPDNSAPVSQWAIYQKLRCFVRLYTSLDSRYTQETVNEEQSSIKPLCSHTDIQEAGKNAFRTLLASSISACFWFTTGWPEGGLALT